MTSATLPRLDLAAWEPTRLHLQLLCQIVGKVRLALHPPLNHWWHVTLQLTARGLSTGMIPWRDGSVEIELDLCAHELRARTSDLREARIPLGARPLRQTYAALMDALAGLGIEVQLQPRPYRCGSEVPFAEDEGHAAYDAEAVHTAWRVLTWCAAPMLEFRSAWLGKCSPTQMFWHSFDLATTRFSGRPAPDMPQADRVTREAYSHEVISAGFWFGDDQVPEAAFYAYAAPSPAGLESAPIRPQSARWQMVRGSPMALLTYEDIRKTADPLGAVREFLQSTYEAAANRAGWDRVTLERQTGW